MALRDLSERDVHVIGQSLRAAVEGPYFPEWEFHTLFGVTRDYVASLMREWPQVDDQDPAVFSAVKGALGNLACYPHGEDLEPYVLASPDELLEIMELWRKRTA